MFLSLLACAIVNWPQSYRKSHEKAPDKTEKVSAEVKVLFLCSERDVFANFGKHLRGDAEERGEVL